MLANQQGQRMSEPKTTTQRWQCPCGKGASVWRVNKLGVILRASLALDCEACATDWEPADGRLRHRGRYAEMIASQRAVESAADDLHLARTLIDDAKTKRGSAFLTQKGIKSKKAQHVYLQVRGLAQGVSYTAFWKNPASGFATAPDQPPEALLRETLTQAWVTANKAHAELMTKVGRVFFDPIRESLWAKQKAARVLATA